MSGVSDATDTPAGVKGTDTLPQFAIGLHA